MLMDIVAALNEPHSLLKPLKLHSPVNLINRDLICGLHTDFKLYKPGPHIRNQLKFLLIQQIRRYLKVKVCHTIVIRLYKTPQLHCMSMIAVESSVHKLNLWHLLVYEKLKLPFDNLSIPETQCFIHRRQTIAARKRTSPAALVVDDAV